MAGRLPSLSRSCAGRGKLTIAEHERLFEAIAANDPDAAGAAMRDHLTRANELYRRSADATEPRSRSAA
jgi:DNA-binding FadR family transcriptional regulator